MVKTTLKEDILAYIAREKKDAEAVLDNVTLDHDFYEWSSNPDNGPYIQRLIAHIRYDNVTALSIMSRVPRKE